MQYSEKNVLTATDEAICAFFIEDASRLRRIVELMPEGDLSANFLNTLWAYAVKHDRLVDLANVFLGFDSSHKTVEGNENWRLPPGGGGIWHSRCTGQRHRSFSDSPNTANPTPPGTQRVPQGDKGDAK